VLAHGAFLLQVLNAQLLVDGVCLLAAVDGVFLPVVDEALPAYVPAQAELSLGGVQIEQRHLTEAATVQSVEAVSVLSAEAVSVLSAEAAPVLSAEAVSA